MATSPAPDDLPEVLDTHQVAAALHQSVYRTQAQLRDGLLPGIKRPGGRWRVRRDDIDAPATHPTPAE
jgi:Helix-turn-helix domain